MAAPKPWKPWSRVWGSRCDIPATRGRTFRDVARRSGSGRRRRGPAYQGGRCGHPGGASAAHAGLCTAVQAPHSYRGIFPNAESCLRLVRALAVEMHENWLEAHRYLNMDDLREHKKEALRMAA